MTSSNIEREYPAPPPDPKPGEFEPGDIPAPTARCICPQGISRIDCPVCGLS